MRALFLLLMFLTFAAAKLSAQHSFIRELPVRGIPKYMYQTADKGFLLAAQLYENFASKDVAVFKYDQYGNLVNTISILNGISVTGVNIRVFAPVRKKQIFLLMISRPDSGICMYHLNQDGNIVKVDYLYNSPGIFKLFETVNDNYLCYGSVPGNSYIYKLDSAFAIIDSTIFPSYSQYWRVNSTGELLLSGPPDNPNFPSTIYYYLYNDSLRQVASKTYMDKDHLPFAVADGWLLYFKGLLKLNRQLDSVWYHPLSDYKFTGTQDQEATDMKELPDGGFIMTGKVWNSFFHTVYLIRVDEQGNLIWKEGYSEAVVDNVVSVEATDDGGYVMFQSGDPDATNRPRMFLVKTNGDGTLGINDTYAQSSLGVSAYPNPSRDRVNILFKDAFSGSLQLFDVMGKLLYTEELWDVSSHSMDITSYPGGVLLLQVQDGTRRQQTLKLVHTHRD